MGDSGIDETRFWQADEWIKAKTEIELTVFDDLSPEGDRLNIGTGDKNYGWHSVASDPLGVDEAQLFIIRYNEG